MQRRPLIQSLALLAAPTFAFAQSDDPSNQPRMVRPGDAAPMLTGKTMDQRSFKLSDDPKSVKLVAFWATWCPTCRVEMPEFRRAQEKWMKSGFDLVTVSIDRRLDDVVTYDRLVERTVPMSQRFAQLWRGAPDHKDEFGPVLTTPTSYLIGRNQKVAAVFRGRVTEAQWAQVEREIAKKA
jgi:peroxiredoxin